MLKNFIEKKIKKRINKFITDKAARKQFLDEAVDVIDALEDPWWATAIGFIPVIGDVFDLANVPIKIKRAINKADALESKVNNAAIKKLTKKVESIETTGYNNVERHLAKRNKSGYNFGSSEEMVDYGGKFFKRSGENIAQFTDDKGYIFRIDKITQECGIVQPDGKIMSVFKVTPKGNSDFSNASEYLLNQVDLYGIK